MIYIINFSVLLLVVAFITAIIILLVCISVMLGGHNEVEQAEVSSYECGFNPFTDTRFQFDIKFYLIAVLFVLFDLEIVLLFPFTVTISSIGRFGYFIVMFFLALLTIAFVYEWKNNSFDFIELKNIK